MSWSHRPPTRGWRLPTVDARSRKPKGALDLWTRVRRFVWSWWPWALVSIWGITDDRLGWALGAGAIALLAYLTAPAALPPRFGLSHEFDVESDEFLATIAGASSTPFVDGNAIELLNNGDAFYPRMLEAIEGAEVSITVEAYIYWAGEVGQLFARALAERASAGVTVKILLDAIGSKTEDVRSPGTTRFTGTRSAASTTAHIGSRSSSTDASRLPEERASATIGEVMPVDRINGAICRSASRAPR
jgi:hypothetical protein